VTSESMPVLPSATSGFQTTVYGPLPNPEAETEAETRTRSRCAHRPSTDLHHKGEFQVALTRASPNSRPRFKLPQ
jgi:hypothetical protein